MSEGTRSFGDEQAVVGEPASHPHQAVVVGEPPVDVAPVLGEPAFANGLQDQQPICPPSVDMTSPNGVPSTPHTPYLEDSSSHVNAPSSAPAVEQSPYLQQVLAAEASESGIGEGVTHQLEASAAENSGPHVDEVSSASTDVETPVTPSTHDAVRSVEAVEVSHIEDEHEADIPEVEEVSHIEDSSYEAPLPQVPTENPFMALDEGPAADENAPGEILSGTDEALDANASSTPDEISSKGLGDEQEEASLSCAVQEKPSMEHITSTQTNVDDGPLEGSKVVNEDVHAAELEQVGQGGTLAQVSGAKEANLEEETGSSVVEHPLTPELDQASVRDIFVQGSGDIPAESETASREVEHVLSGEVTQSEVSTIESSTPQKDENRAAPIAFELKNHEEIPVEAPPADSSVAPQGTRALAIEECLVNQPPTEETSFPPAANGDNHYQHGEDVDCALEREQDLPKDEDDANAEVEKPTSRLKLPLIFTGLAIAAVGVAVASISRPH